MTRTQQRINTSLEVAILVGISMLQAAHCAWSSIACHAAASSHTIPSRHYYKLLISRRDESIRL